VYADGIHSGEGDVRIAMRFGGPWRFVTARASSLPCRRSRVRVPSSASKDSR